MNIAFIPARSGSKRIPSKNKRPFLGKPMFLWPAQILLNLDYINKVYISTDDDEIINIASGAKGLSVFKRSQRYSDDYSTSIDALKEFESTLNDHYQNIVMIYPTTPILHMNKLESALKKLANSKFNSAMSVREFPHPIERSLTVKEDGSLAASVTALNKRTQDLQPKYYDAANFYIFKKSFFQNKDLTLYDNSLAIKLSPTDISFDIDTLDDWNHAENYMRLIMTRGS